MIERRAPGVEVYVGPERRRAVQALSQEQIDYIIEQAVEKAATVAATKAAEIAVKQLTDDLHRKVGKSVLDKAVWVIGVLVVGVTLWAQSKGLMK
jgi:uncharacterized protein YaaW (UPF0174 family)